jgi:membrane-associated phospholipid phosphatase
MLISTVRTAIAPCLVVALLSAPLPAVAQVAAQPDQQSQPATTPPPPDKGQQVAAAEEPAKPTRSFFPALFHNLGDDVKHIPRKNTLYWLAAGAATSLAIHPADDNINDRLSNSDSAKTFFKAGKYIGSFPVLLGTAVTTYIVGRSRPSRRAQHLGMDLIEATLLSEGFTELIKVTVRRERPLQDNGKRASGYAFPSGHAAATFAAATVLQQHLGWKWAVPTYAIGSYVAMSRLADDRHWASDVMAGAAEGIIIGRSVTWHGRNFYASPMLLPKGAGVMVNVNVNNH